MKQTKFVYCIGFKIKFYYLNVYSCSPIPIHPCHSCTLFCTSLPIPAKWFQRIVLWGFFGPPNCIVDLLYHRGSDEDGCTMQMERNQNLNIQKMREDKIKAAAMKKFMFGNFGLEVPNLLRHPERFTSIPQISSLFDGPRMLKCQCNRLLWYGPRQT